MDKFVIRLKHNIFTGIFKKDKHHYFVFIFNQLLPLIILGK